VSLEHDEESFSSLFLFLGVYFGSMLWSVALGIWGLFFFQDFDVEILVFEISLFIEMILAKL